MSMETKDFSKVLKPGDRVFVSEYGYGTRRKRRILSLATVKTVGKVHIVVTSPNKSEHKYRLNGAAAQSGDSRYHDGIFRELIEVTPITVLEHRKQEDVKFIKALVEAMQTVDLYSIPDARFGDLVSACKKVEAAIDGKLPSQET